MGGVGRGENAKVIQIRKFKLKHLNILIIHKLTKK